MTPNRKRGIVGTCFQIWGYQLITECISFICFSVGPSSVLRWTLVCSLLDPRLFLHWTLVCSPLDPRLFSVGPSSVLANNQTFSHFSCLSLQKRFFSIGIKYNKFSIRKKKRYLTTFSFCFPFVPLIV